MNYVDDLIKRYNELEHQKLNILNACNTIIQCHEKGRKLLVCGNGGSASDSEHIVGELAKGFLLKRPMLEKHITTFEKQFPKDAACFKNAIQCGLPAISLVSQVSLITAIANDIGSHMIFAQQVYAYGREGDVLITISTSGNSVNVINAVKIASCMGVKTIGLTGEKESQLNRLCDITINAPSEIVYEIQEYHVAIYHAVCAVVENYFFES